MVKPTRLLWPIACSTLALLSVWQFSDRRQLRLQLESALADVAHPEADGAMAEPSTSRLATPSDSGELAPEPPGTPRAHAISAVDPDVDLRADPPEPDLVQLPREQLEQLRAELDQLRETQWSLQLRQSEAATIPSQRVRELLEARDYPEEVVDQVDMEVRLSLRGATVTDEDLLWLGGRMLIGDWPVADDDGRGNLELSLAQRLGPVRLANSLELPALMSVLERSSDRALSEVWDEASLRRAYERFPPMRRLELRTFFPIAFAFAHETD